MYRHGHRTKTTKSSEYNSWQQLKRRCLAPTDAAYKEYGGRGITVCERWLDFRNFIADMGLKPSPSHSIDRIDNDKGYFPENCRWATKQEQARNTRHCHFVEYNGQIITVKALSELSSLRYDVVWHRIKRMGLNPVDAISIPLRNRLRIWASADKPLATEP